MFPSRRLHSVSSVFQSMLKTFYQAPFHIQTPQLLLLHLLLCSGPSSLNSWTVSGAHG